ncbi:MAG: copper-translocating P-type ATPase [Firmicutes bacterium HGW-Firmicutes-20]|jgi:Zn2+/Cd2+-exporting ATPase|nr:MAG: copper-translocating P-type ATPase [Firmicutes bacterium HGW-Firmicutes-20]PKM67772.1 MAG: copper-translocating P-type ATPase [Firmicutes bacterium HGW-Firmicutes-19]
MKFDVKTRLISATLLIILGWISHWLSLSLMFYVFMILATTLTIFPIAKTAMAGLRYKVIGIDTLVSIAVIGALLIGEVWEAAAVSYLYTLGHYLENRTLKKTRGAIASLLDNVPKRVTIIENGISKEISAHELKIGDILFVRSGERIAADGIIIDGSAMINESSITGESVPIVKNTGERVYSSTLIDTGVLNVKADHIGEDSTYGRIIALVEEAQDKKAKIQRSLEKFAQYYTPSVILLTIFVYIFTLDIRLALTLLVISCPGALVISAPVSIVAGIGNGAKNGILFKGGDVMEKLSAVNVVAFDKTGTLTSGELVIKQVYTHQIDEKELLFLAASLENSSEHPLAKAVIRFAQQHQVDLTMAKDVEVLPGFGLKGVVSDRSVIIGSPRLFDDQKRSLMDNQIKKLESDGLTVIAVSVNDEIKGLFGIADQIRPSTKSVVDKLKKMNILPVMLTGDHSQVALAIGKQSGIDIIKANCLPADKVNYLKELKSQYGMTVMVGDGINDAPALANADFGIAMGSYTNHTAMENADVILSSSKLEKLPYAIELSKATTRNMRTNIVFALIVAFSLMIGVLTKHVFLSVGMLIHELSVLIVIINAIRLLKFKNKDA